jgi:hypothetical protein
VIRSRKAAPTLMFLPETRIGIDCLHSVATLRRALAVRH